MKTKLMKYDHIPRKYHLLWDEVGRTLRIQVHKDCLQLVRPVQKDCPWVRTVSERHELDGLFDGFSGDLRAGSFGFNHAIMKVGESGDYIEYVAKIPEIKILTQFDCGDCDGTGKRNPELFSEGHCLHCAGSGKMGVLDWRSAYIMTASLGLLFEILDVNEETSAVEHQLVTVKMMSDYGLHGSSIGGDFGIDFMDHVRSGPSELKSIIEHTTQAMRTAHAHMFTLDEYDRMRIRVDYDNGQIGLTVPGDACGINTSFDSSTKGEGRDFSCHNVDSPLQSLALLAGIASMSGQVGHYIGAKRKLERSLVV